MSVMKEIKFDQGLEWGNITDQAILPPMGRMAQGWENSHCTQVVFTSITKEAGMKRQSWEK